MIFPEQLLPSLSKNPFIGLSFISFLGREVGSGGRADTVIAFEVDSGATLQPEYERNLFVIVRVTRFVTIGCLW